MSRTNEELNLAVAKLRFPSLTDMTEDCRPILGNVLCAPFLPSTDWRDGGPLLIDILSDDDGYTSEQLTILCANDKDGVLPWVCHRWIAWKDCVDE